MLSYAQQFGLPLELFASGPLGENWVLRNAPGHRLSGRKVRYRDLYHDEIGYAAERLAGLLQERGDLSPEDAALLAWARKFGLLDGDAQYRGAAARGWAATPGVTSAGVPETPFAAEDVWSYGPLGDAAGWTNSAVYPTPVLTITGGIDGLANGFARRLPADVIQLGAEVVSLRQDEKGVAVRWRDAASGAVAEEVADQAVCTIPFTVLSHVDADFDPAVQRIIANLAYVPVVKAGLAFRRRFWEEDDRIFGGYSYIDDPNMALIYPSAGLGSATGILTNYYLGARDCLRMGGLAPDERRRRALADVELIHPEAEADFESAVSVVWSRMPWSAGCAGAWTPDSRARDLPRVAAGDRRVMFAGEHVSHIPAWMEGAVVSAHAGLRLLRDTWKNAP